MGSEHGKRTNDLRIQLLDTSVISVSQWGSVGIRLGELTGLASLPLGLYRRTCATSLTARTPILNEVRSVSHSFLPLTSNRWYGRGLSMEFMF